MALQRLLPIFDYSEIVESFARNSDGERGAVFTRHEVVEFILDLVGYTADSPLHERRILEPSFGHGDFLLPIADRLLRAYVAHVPDGRDVVTDLSDAVRAVEVHHDSVMQVHVKLRELLRNYGISDQDAGQLLVSWLIEGDFLLVDINQTFTHSVGNPPYVRQELVPDLLMTEYRSRYHTIYDRADLYIPFIERCLTSLGSGGILGFICSDRWMKNRYGGPLRAMVAKQYHLSCYIDMVDTPAFHSDVIAYPAITIIKREKPGPTRVAHRPQIDRKALCKITQAMQSEPLGENGPVAEVTGVVNSSEPWILQSFDQLAVVRRLESDFPLIEEVGCTVGIGVATGADKVFIAPFESLDVELECKLPLVTTKDIANGYVKWGGLGVINPFLEDGSLVNLEEYPRLARYFEMHSGVLRLRNCVKRNRDSWYRTIDRIYPELMQSCKLLIPDIKGKANIVYEAGCFYPHHNLYYIVSDEWDLVALQAVLLSGIARLFVSIYSTKMRGDYLRFQAQYLRRIRLPHWLEISQSVREALVYSANIGNIDACNQAVSDLYQFTHAERVAIGMNGD